MTIDLAIEFSKYRNRSIFIDTQQLLILLIGNYDKQNGGNFLNNLDYSHRDCEGLQNFIDKLEAKIIISPHILTEVSNLINTKIPKNMHSKVRESTIDILLNYIEENASKDEIIITNNKTAKLLGFPDTATIIICKNKDFPLITNDGNLIREFNKEKLDVIPYGYIITMSLS